MNDYILPLHLNRKWFEMIASGKKREEYRANTEYWKTRILNWQERAGKKTLKVRFFLGYAKDAQTMLYSVDSYVGFHDWCRHPQWGEPEGFHYVIYLKKRIYLSRRAK